VYWDGEAESSVRPECLRRFKPYRVGDHVEVREEGTKTYVGGKIIAVLSVDDDDDPQFDIEAEEGGVLRMVTADRLRRNPFSSESPPSLKVGSRVMALYGGGEEAFPGTIKAIHSDGTVAVMYDDGEIEPHLPSEFVELSDA
jgi:hypothetical protein